MRLARVIALLCVLQPALAFGQGSVLQSGPPAPGHVPQYVGAGSQAVIMDGGGAAGGRAGVNPSELGLTARGTGTPPYAGQGKGPFGTNFCDYDAPIDNAAGYHFLCLSANAQGGGLITYGNAGIAPPLPLQIILNGVVYPFPFSVGGIVGPGTTIVGDLVLWNNTAGTLVKDSGFGVSGIDANVLNTQTANYTIASTDCGKTIQAGTGSTGQFTLTLPSVSGFPANCSVAIKNGDSTRGKVLAGFPAGFVSAQNVLWPLQYGTVRIINGAWAAGVAPGRWIQTTNVPLQANHSSGSDTNNDCLGTGTGACATIIRGFQALKTEVVVPGGSSPTIQSDCGFTESPSGAFIGSVGSGTGVLFIVGNEASPANCVWNTGGLAFDDGNVTSLRGFTARSSGTFAFVQKGGTLVFANMICGANTGACFQVNEGGSLTWDPGTLQLGEISCAPNCFAFGVVNNGGTVSLQQASITMPSVLNFTTIYSGNFSGSRGFISTTFSGPGSGVASTGTQFILSNLASLALSATVMPGNTAGTLSSGACREGVCAQISNLMFPSPIAFVTLPVCSATTEGAQQTVADSTSNTWGANAAGGGANRVLLYCNGANWTVSAK